MAENMELEAIGSLGVNQLASLKRVGAASCIIVLAAFIAITAYDFFNEVWPRQALFETAARVDLDLSAETTYETAFEPEYPGRYRVSLTMRQRNKGDKTDAYFTYRGKFRLRGGNGEVLEERFFSDELSRRYVGTKLGYISISRWQMWRDLTFEIEFDEGAEKFNEHYHDMRVYVIKSLKYSVFD